MMLTVICWDGHTLATDSMLTAGDDVVTKSFNKLTVFKEDITYMNDKILALGIAGECSHFDRVLNWFLTGEEADDHNTACIVVGVKYAYELEPKSGWMIKHNKKEKLAVGSGCVWALSAMRLGFDSKQAVRHAIDNCTSCGGKIRSWINE